MSKLPKHIAQLLCSHNFAFFVQNMILFSLGEVCELYIQDINLGSPSPSISRDTLYRLYLPPLLLLHPSHLMRVCVCCVYLNIPQPTLIP